ncbi:UNVERIFIED_CONTAM: hypothetical protein FKN15_015925 [Acipenser sinensis]
MPGFHSCDVCKTGLPMEDSSSSPPPASPPKKRRRKSHQSHRLASSEQLDKLWAVVSQKGTVLAKLLCEWTAPPISSVPLEKQGVTDAEWQQENLLSITASEEMGDQEFPSEKGDSDSAILVTHLSLSAELMLLIKRATDALQVRWPLDQTSKQLIFEDDPAPSQVFPPVHPDFLFEVHSSWGHPATAPAVSRSMGTLYSLHEVGKLGLANFPPVDDTIASLVQHQNKGF